MQATGKSNEQIIAYLNSIGMLERQVSDLTDGEHDLNVMLRETADVAGTEGLAGAMLEAEAVMELYSSALKDNGLSTAAITYETNRLSSTLGITASAEEQAKQDAELLAEAYKAGVISLGAFRDGLQQAAQGALVLSESERQSLQDQIASAAAARDLAAARAEAAAAAAEQAQSTMNLAGSLKDATDAEIASRLIGMLDPEAMGVDAYTAAVQEIGLSFGIMDEKSIALASNLGNLASALENGVIPAESADEALAALIQDAADGQVTMLDLISEFARAPGEIEPTTRAIERAEARLADITVGAPGAISAIDAVGSSASTAKQPVSALNNALGTTATKLSNLVTGSPWVIEVVARGGGVPEYAAGGMVPYSQWALVGERGPELVYLPAGAEVFSHRETQRRLNVGQQVSVTVNTGPISSQIDVEDLAWRISEVLGRRLKAVA